MSNIDKRAQKELYAKVERQAHSLRGNPREYQAVTGLCPVNVIEMHAQKIQALLDELDAKDRRIAELERKEQHSERQSVIDALAGSGEEWSDIEEYMQKWDAERASAAGKGE
ncbi:hypothetical protein [Enterobacter kobei]|uniref:hypothetical protein n=1 Tax=Enterobacter kobei TaxID=208224 RepID=UPI0023797F09|nr:hypothetical protein [Enterobacter kobei]MDD9222617.1 hypothetical protein [Enterobacter kobei]